MDHDLIVIGTGVAARTAATLVRRAGRSVAIVDERPYGGTCALRGCDPKKMLVAGAEAVEASRRMRGNGTVGELKVDWGELIAFKRTFTEPIPDQHERRYQDRGISTFCGTARFAGPNSLSVGDRSLSARHILIASGAEPVPVGIAGEEHLVTSERFMAMETLPRRIVLVGGGYIAAEFSHIAARAGAEVVILQRGDRILKHFEPELVGWLMDVFVRIGVKIHVGTTVKGIEKVDRSYRVHALRDGREEAFETDLVVHAAGRAPALERLDLDAGEVAVDKGRLVLDDHLQSVSNPAVYAAGDAAQAGPPLTPVSAHHAKIVAANLLEGNRLRPDYRGVPSVAFTLPPIASVGSSEADAKERGLRFHARCELVPDWYAARRVNEKVYGYKILVEEPTGRIIGAHLVGPHADEVINLFAMAIRHDLTADALRSTLFAYPTGASDIGAMLNN